MTAKAEQKKTNGAANPTTTSKSEMLRVGIGFAEWARAEAEKAGTTLAQFTDTLPDIMDTLLD